jgi:hypothetical protein
MALPLLRTALGDSTATFRDGQLLQLNAASTNVWLAVLFIWYGALVGTSLSNVVLLVC